MSALVNNNAVTLAKILCQQEIQACRRIHRDDEHRLSLELCILLGETLKVAIACERSESSLTDYLDDMMSSNELLPREKLILDCMRMPFKGAEYLDDISKTISYQSDASICAAVTHQVSHVLQLAGHYNESFEAIGRYLVRFQAEDPKTLAKLEQGSDFFFDCENTRWIRSGEHQYLRLPRSCLEKDNRFVDQINTLAYCHFGLYGSNESLMNVLSDSIGNYTIFLLTEGLRRKLDPDFLRPIIGAYINSEFFTNFYMRPLTHLPWGGEHLSLLKPLLPSEKSIIARIKDGEDLSDTLELAAHVGEHELASRINDEMFNWAYKNEFNGDEDIYYTACIAADLSLEEAEHWLQYGNFTELDLHFATYYAAQYLCCRGWELSEAVDYIRVERIDEVMIADKWANGFDVAKDIEYFLNSSCVSSASKIASLRFLGAKQPVPQVDGGT